MRARRIPVAAVVANFSDTELEEYALALGKTREEATEARSTSRELFYPERAIMLARNIYDGDSRVLISRRR